GLIQELAARRGLTAPARFSDDRENGLGVSLLHRPAHHLRAAMGGVTDNASRVEAEPLPDARYHGPRILVLGFVDRQGRSEPRRVA
ncbi:MAG: hypothetical protein AAFY66_15665, partial [Pseudomonadota bacterium]